MAAPEAWRARSCWFCEVAAATTMEATSREAAPAKSSASGPSAPPALFELCGRAVSAHMGVLESGVWALPGPILQSILPLLNIYYLERIEETALKKGLSTQAIWRRLWDELMKTRPSSLEGYRIVQNLTYYCSTASNKTRLSELLEIGVPLYQEGWGAHYVPRLTTRGPCYENYCPYENIQNKHMSTGPTYGSPMCVNLFTTGSGVLSLLSKKNHCESEVTCRVRKPHSNGACEGWGDASVLESTGHSSKRARGAESEDLYDFVFIVAGEKEDGEEMEIGEVACGALDGSDPSCLGLPALEASQRFRSISTLELFTVPLSTEAALTLCHLLSSWVSLESLTLSYNGLGSNIFRLLDSLRALSGQTGCRLRALHLSDLFSPLPILELTRAIVRALPLLRVLSIRVDHPSQRDNPVVPENAGPPGHIIGDEEIPENCLEQLEMGFPRGAQPAPLLSSVLKASGSLQQLSLDSATFASPQDFGLVLQTLKEYNLSLKRLSFHDMNLADCQSEVLFLLKNLTLQEITFSFCRLFEKCPAQFLPEMNKN
ncbi:leucine-rich repeat-containing protein 41 [Mastomys coucha]|uniref:leucine-rich repeat-containing protein 41 n=1 Tax=Mastomys coucha TaxID=35658 RepID=UPI0012628E47|nr:leucine-rich repeat-containing protein 41 [Mastomys coucha]